MVVRDAVPADVTELLKLMTSLAKFEDYIEDFAVTHKDILTFGFGPNALFHALIAEDDEQAVGMAITYVVPWTYTLRPKLVLKELYVDDAFRFSGIGKALFDAVRRRGNAIGACEIVWTVMKGNQTAEEFYRSVGGTPDLKWNNWTIDLDHRKVAWGS